MKMDLPRGFARKSVLKLTWPYVHRYRFFLAGDETSGRHSTKHSINFLGFLGDTVLILSLEDLHKESKFSNCCGSVTHY